MINLKGKIIVITGVDASGKETQTKLLAERLPNTKRVSFPNYETPTGKSIRSKLMSGVIPNRIESYDDESKVIEFAKLYTADRRFTMSEPEILGHLYKGGNVVCDRYSESNFVHQVTKIVNEDTAKQLNDRRRLESLLYNYEHNTVRVPKADLVIYLGLSIDTVMNLLQKRGEVLDAHESDREYMSGCIDNGKRLCEDYGYEYIDCEDSNGIRSIESIHESIMEVVLKYLQ